VITIKKDKIRQATVLFTNAFIKKIAVGKDASLIKKYVSNYIDIDGGFGKQNTYMDVICSAYACFENVYRFEYLYKNKLLNQLLIKKYKGKNTTVFTEMNVGRAIADLVLINGTATLFEIKTELDKTYRLESQILNYYKCFDQINIVTHESLGMQYHKLAKAYNVGLIIYNSQHELVVVKKPEVWKNDLSHLELFKLLRKSEILSILKKRNIVCNEVPNTKFFEYYLSLIKQLDVNLFQSLVFQELKSRKLDYSPTLLREDIPLEIKLIYNCLQLDSAESNYLLNLLNQKIKR
jgi:hypothetical protein